MSASNTTWSPPLQPPDYQKKAAREFRHALRGARSKEGAPVRRIFASDPDVDKPALASLLSGAGGRGGGRGGQVRIKLLLSLLWVCSAAPYTTQRPASAFAALLGLDDYQDSGSRRIQQALRDLADRGFVRVQQQGAHSPTIELLSETGNGSRYTSPVEAYNTLSRKEGTSAAELRAHRYFRVPTAYWADGWVSQLSGAATAMYLAMLAEKSPKATEVWFSPSRAEARFGLAASTRKAGIKELQEAGAIATTSRSVSETGRIIDPTRRRNVYRLDIE